MTTLISKKFKRHIGEQLIESITEPANNVYYVMAARHFPFANNDATTPVPFESFEELEVTSFEEGIFGKKINSSDVSLMIPKYVWTSNTIYTPYDHQDTSITSKQYYVVVDGGATYYVYKCLDNNRGVASNTQPTNTSESACNFITTADGYTWKLMYSMPEATFEKFATADYMPVVTSANVAGNTVPGAIDVIRITNPGSNYIATLTGQFQVNDLRESIPEVAGNTTTYRLATNASSNTDFYVGSAIYITTGTGAGQLKRIVDYNAVTRVATVNSMFTVAPSSDSTYIVAPNVVINGDGSGAVAYATVSSNATVNNFISKINIINRGNNYTYASALVTGNTGGVSNTAVLRPIIPPVGGHGKNAPSELGAKAVGVSVSFNTSEGGYVTTDNDYRKLILLRDPLFRNVTLTLDNEVGTFVTGENVYQIEYKTLLGTATGNTTSTTVRGVGTQFNLALKENDRVLITDTISGVHCLRTVTSVINSTAISVNDELPFLTEFARCAYVSILASGVKTGNASPYLTMSNVEPKFVTSKIVIGETSGAFANVTNINVNEKNYNNWNTFDNRTRISYTTKSGTMPEDAKVLQTDISLSNAYYHSSNSTYVFLTVERGPINADPAEQIREDQGAASFTLSSVSSGEVIYIENSAAISRDPSQSETLRLIINF